MVREKDLSAKDLYALTADLRELTRKTGTLLIVNDRIDVALATRADGVHLGWQSLPVERVREIVGPDRLIGVSTHSADEARRSRDAGADYVTFGPVFATPSKEGLVEPQGLEGVRRAAENLRIPLVGLGGIDPANAADVLRAGADGVAAIRSLLAVEDPESAARRMIRALEQALEEKNASG
jgi:thiamine-phosphate pyrophosphorylase